MQVAGTGLELSHETTGNSIGSPQSGAESGAHDAQSGTFDPDLAAFVDAWPTLPEPLKAGILALVRAAEGGA